MAVLGPAVAERVVVRAHGLGHDVVDVEAEPVRAGVEGHDRLADRELLECGDAELDHEMPAGAEVRGGVLEARHLRVLRGQVADRVEDEVDERELPVDAGRGHVSGHGLDVLGAGLVAQAREHRLGAVDAGHADAALCERKRDAAGADRELERAAVAGEAGQHVDRRVEGRGVEHRGGVLVVARRHLLAEELLRHAWQSATPVESRDRQPSIRPVEVALPRPRPERVTLAGDRVRVEGLDPGRHAADLFRLGHDGSQAAEQSWAYLPYGPFASAREHRSWLDAQAASEDPLFFAVVDLRDGCAVGVATLLRIEPSQACIEIGHIWLSPRLQRTAAATEALVLLLRYALDDLGYRRMEWKCDAANQPSRSAAARLGFRFEGIFYNHMVVKGRNRDTAWFSILDEEWPALRDAYAAWLAPDNFGPDGAQRRRLTELTAR